jgi:hypothetical protein
LRAVCLSPSRGACRVPAAAVDRRGPARAQRRPRSRAGTSFARRVPGGDSRADATGSRAGRAARQRSELAALRTGQPSSALRRRAHRASSAQLRNAHNRDGGMTSDERRQLMNRPADEARYRAGDGTGSAEDVGLKRLHLGRDRPRYVCRPGHPVLDHLLDAHGDAEVRSPLDRMCRRRDVRW